MFSLTKSTYPENSVEDRQFSLKILIPIIVFIAKIGVNASF